MGSGTKPSAPSFVERFLAALETSRVLLPEQMSQLRGESAVTGDERMARTIADLLISRQLLTRWQADQLLQGRSTLRLGPYTLLENLGKGSMASVYRAEDDKKRIVAVKVMAPELMNNPESLARFQREIRLTTSLRHPNLVSAYRADTIGKYTLLVMEYYPGKDLKQWLTERGPFPVGIACECIVQAALGLQYAFERGMVHRDIKPANLLIARPSANQPPLVKVLDMGLAKFLADSRRDGRLTGTGQMIGTPDYIAPEQAKNPRDADTRSDVFSLGCTLFELLTGQLPFIGKGVVERLMARMSKDAPLIRSVRKDIPEPLEKVVAKMLALRPDDRYQTPGMAGFALTPFAKEIRGSASNEG